MMSKSLVLAAFVCMYLGKSYSQGRDIPVEIIVDKLSHKNIRGFLEKTTEAVYKFYNGEISQENCITNKCIVLKSSDKEKSVNTSEDPVLSSIKALKVFRISQNTEVISLKMETFKNDKGDVCEFDKGDNHHSLVSLDIKLSDLNPGVFSNPLVMVAKDEKFTATIRVRYGLPVPIDIKPENIEKINDATKAITLKSQVDLTNKTNLTYLWEYSIDEENNWKELGKTISESVVFFPNRDVFKKTIKGNQTIHMRMKAVSSEIAGPYSATCDMQFTPTPPKFDNNDVTTQETCPNSPTGSISIKGLTGVADKFAYYIIKSKTLAADDYPDVIERGKKVFSGTVNSSKPLVIEKLDEGDYSIVIYNADVPVGKMFSTYSFNIKKYSLLVIKSESVTEATCANMPDGQILIEIEGGSPGKLITTITPAVGKSKQFSHNIVFTELTPGTYTVFVKDQCSQTIATKELEILKKTIQIKGKVEIATEPLNNFPNGSIKVNLEGGSGQYKYILAKGTNAGLEKTTLMPVWIIDNLTKGSYKLKIIDMSYPQCPGWDTIFILTGKTLGNDSTISQPEKPEKKDSSQSALSVKKKYSRPAIYSLNRTYSITVEQVAGMHLISGKTINILPEHALSLFNALYVSRMNTTGTDRQFRYVPIIFGSSG